jgi:hypothetical protein
MTETKMLNVETIFYKLNFTIFGGTTFDEHIQSEQTKPNFQK